jgi:hypothetical protein
MPEVVGPIREKGTPNELGIGPILIRNHADHLYAESASHAFGIIRNRPVLFST